jgi:uncharacterized membrane protein YdjX (TVP38/TMEM64 family)
LLAATLEPAMRVRPHITCQRVLIAVPALTATAALLYFASGGAGDLIGRWINQDMQTFPFVLLFLALPLVGFPISVFLLLLGALFDTGPALLITFGGMAIHQVLTYLTGNYLLRPFIERQLAKRKTHLPQFPKKGFVWPSVAFIALPGLSYAVKNYIFALSGVPFRYFFPISWLIQAVMSIPLVIAGEVLGSRHYGLISIMFALLAAGYVVRTWLRWRKKSLSGDRHN